MRQVSIGRLLRAFSWIGLSGLGGGRIVYMYDDFVERRRWLSRDEFLPGFALSQLLPGPTLTNLAIFLGQGFRGAAGAAVGVLGVLFPGVLAVWLLSYFYFVHGMNPGLNALLRGLGAAVAGFVLVVTGRMALAAFRGGGPKGVWIAAAAFVSVALLRLDTYLVVVVLGALSLWLHRPGTEKPAEAAPESGP